MSLQSGLVLDHRYALVERLGQGGQGSVWRAFDKNTRVDRALKIIHLPEGNGEAAERARREAHLVKDARHPALVTVHSLFEIPADGVLVLVFDFVAATPLADLLRDERFGRAHRLAALRHIAGALAFLHGKSIVHRDLKPDNVLVTPVFWEDPAAPSSLKLIDFGIAAPRSGPDGATLSGMFGTPPYMAPELFAPADIDAQRSPARDVFAFGVIGWELLDGKHPTGLPRAASAGAYGAAYLHQRRSRDPWPPHTLPGRWGSVIAACLALDPAERPADGRAILAALEDPLTTPAPSAARVTLHGPSTGGEAAHPQPVTEPHRAPSASAPEHDSGASPPGSLLRRGAAGPAVAASRPVERTEIAPPSSLPRSAAAERTTPMPPDIAALSEPPAPVAHRAGRATSADAPAPPDPVPGKRDVADRPDGGTRQIVVIGLLLAALVAAGTAWFVLARGTKGPSPPDSTAPGEGPAILALSPPIPVGLVNSAQSASSPPAASAPSPAASASPIEVCCPRKPGRCPSGRPCSTSTTCSAHWNRLPEREMFLRVIKVEEQPDDPYASRRNLADPGGLPESTVCVRAGEREACAPMTAIAQKGGTTLSRTAEMAPTEPLRVTTSHLRAGDNKGQAGLRLRILNGGRPDHEALLEREPILRIGALCRSLTLKDEKGRLHLTFYLDDVD